MTRKTYKPLDELIDESGLRYRFISQKLDISYNYFWRIRVDPSMMNIVQMEKLASLLGVSFLDVYNIQKKFRESVDNNTTKQPA